MEDKAKKEILSAINVFSTAVDERFEEMATKKDLEQIRDDLGQMATKKDLSKLNHDLKTYIDRKMAEYHSDVFKRLEKKFQQDKHFQKKVIELFQAHNIGTSEDLAYLEGLSKS